MKTQKGQVAEYVEVEFHSKLTTEEKLKQKLVDIEVVNSEILHAVGRTVLRNGKEVDESNQNEKKTMRSILGLKT